MRKLGDFIVWKQMITFAKDTELKALVFVTNDKKEDWWLKAPSGSETAKSPRPELIEEISREAELD